MKNYLTLKIGTFAVFIGLFFSCNKNEDDLPTLLAADLISKKWKIADELITYPGQLEISIYDSLDACGKDDIYEFKLDRTLLITEGLVKCDTSLPDFSINLQWQLSNNDTQIDITDTSTLGIPILGTAEMHNFKMDILELTAMSLKVKYVDSLTGITDKLYFTPY